MYLSAGLAEPSNSIDGVISRFWVGDMFDQRRGGMSGSKRSSEENPRGHPPANSRLVGVNSRG